MEPRGTVDSCRDQEASVRATPETGDAMASVASPSGALPEASAAIALDPGRTTLFHGVTPRLHRVVSFGVLRKHPGKSYGTCPLTTAQQ